MEEEASRNRKKTATLSSETILTARLGCRARTLAASSCTEMEMAIRRAMSTSSERKEARPEPSCVLGVGFANHPLRLSSFDATLNVRGTAESTMDSTSTTEMSSSGDICASPAASSSSFPMPKETEKARSEPKDPRAAAVSVMLPQDAAEVYRLVYPDAVQSALRESHHLPARLAWQAVSEGGHSLVLRRLLVAPRGVKRGTSSGGPVRARYARQSYNSQMASGGTVFGCSLGNLMHHACGRKHRLMHGMRALRRALAPAGRALGCSVGRDRPLLVRGLACHRVLLAQGRKLLELKRAPAIDSKTGHVGVALGATAALLVAFECMALDPRDAPMLSAQLATCMRDTHSALVHWHTPDTLDSDMRFAQDVEIRALERALMGVTRAQEASESSGLAAPAVLRLQLDCYRRAAWPADGRLDVGTHDETLERIRSGELVDREQDPYAAGREAPMVMGLEALAELPGDAPVSRGDAASSSSRSGGGSSSNSSAWSFSSAGPSEVRPRAPVPLFLPDLAQLQASMQDNLLLARVARNVNAAPAAGPTPTPAPEVVISRPEGLG